jgi:AcrR family transcriptional regulator
MTRRTQQQRREATIAKLLEATIECLVEHGYRNTSIGRICTRAGVSHGGLFRHFPSRVALLAAASDEIGRRHLIALRQQLAVPKQSADLPESLIRSFREAAQSPMSAAWRELIVACRTDEELKRSVAPTVDRLESSLIAFAAQIPGAPSGHQAFATLVLSLLHMYDSESATAYLDESPDIMTERDRWATELLRSALHPLPASVASVR